MWCSPLCDPEGNVLGLSGRNLESGQDVLLPGATTALWNSRTLRLYPEILLTRNPVDALSLIAAGYPNTAALVRATLTESDLALIHGSTLRRLIVVDRDIDAGALRTQLPELEVTARALPAPANAILVESGPEALVEAVEDPRADPQSQEAPASRPAVVQAGSRGFTVRLGPRTYEILGLEKSARKLRATVRAEHLGRLHVDTVDFYSARSRRASARTCAGSSRSRPRVIETDVAA